LRALIFQQIFECIARGLRTPPSGKILPLRTPNCAAFEGAQMISRGIALAQLRSQQQAHKAFT